MHNKEEQSQATVILKMYEINKYAKQLAILTAIELVIGNYFPLENVNKHGFLEILSQQSILLVLSFLCMKNGNRFFLVHT